MTSSPADPHGADATFDELLQFVLPLRTVSLTNARTHWAVKANRAKTERATTRSLWQIAKGRELEQSESADVTITRIAPRELDDDNIRAAGKSVRDSLADCLGLRSDRDPRVTWHYKQRKGKPKEYAVLVEVRYSLAAARPCACTGEAKK